MLTTDVGIEKDYFLPEDGAAAKAAALALMKSFDECWISAFGFTLQPMFDALKLADKRGSKIHILLDHSQETGHAEAALVKDLAASLTHGDLTVTTAGVNSGQPSAIYHWKSMVYKTGDKVTCWEGSTNFSKTGWVQGNSARIFSSQAWADVFIKNFEVHRAWALANEPQYAPVKKPRKKAA
jgi:hypothetical protein